MKNKRLYKREGSTKHLVKGCIAQERWAQEEFYRMYSPKMYSICMRYANDVDEAQEFLQMGFIKVFTKLDKYNGAGSLEGWVRTTVVRNTLDLLKKRNKIQNVELDEKHAEILLEDNEISEYENLSQEIIFSEIQKLEDKQQLIFNLFHMEELSHKEISEELNILESTSRSILRRAKQNLKKQLERYL